MRILHTVRQILSRAVHGLGLEGVPFSFMAGPGAGTGFQTFVNKELPLAVAGDFAGANIRASVVAGAWQYVASPGGVTVGAMGWANPATNQITSYYTAPAASCFIHRESQATIINSPGIGGPIASMQVLNGQRVIGYDQGEFWGLFTAGATIGNKVYANAVTGALTAAATGNSVTGAITSLSVATTGVMTVNTITGTPLAIGQVIIAPGVPNGSYIASLGTGTGGTGTYNLANVDGTAFVVVTTQAGNYYGAQETQFALAQNVTADCDFTGSLAVPAAGVAFGVLTVTAVASGTLTPGQWLSATGGGGLLGSANCQILEQLTSTAGGGALGTTGTYQVSNAPAVVTSTNTFVATQGKLGKISSWATWT